MSATIRNRVLATAAAASVALVLVGCSSDDDSNASASNTSPPTTAASAMTTPSTTANEQTIVDIAAGNDDFSTLVSAVQAADLGETLSGTGPFTVFAPTNEAFDKLPAGTLDNLLKPENKETLAGILKYHVVPGKVMAADVQPGTVKTANGDEFTVNVDNGTVTITDGQGNTAKVVQTDIAGSNGVIHVIDGVLLPPQ